MLLSVAPIAGASKTTGDAATLLRTQGTQETERHERGVAEEREAWEAANSLNLYLYLQETAQQLRCQGHVVQTRLAHGDPAGEIVRSSEERHADLIVMTSHGRGGLHRLWVSSVATEVVRRATVPVLLVNTGEYDEREEDGEGIQDQAVRGALRPRRACGPRGSRTHADLIAYVQNCLDTGCLPWDGGLAELFTGPCRTPPGFSPSGVISATPLL